MVYYYGEGGGLLKNYFDAADKKIKQGIKEITEMTLKAMHILFMIYSTLQRLTSQINCENICAKEAVKLQQS